MSHVDRTISIWNLRFWQCFHGSFIACIFTFGISQHSKKTLHSLQIGTFSERLLMSDTRSRTYNMQLARICMSLIPVEGLTIVNVSDDLLMHVRQGRQLHSTSRKWATRNRRLIGTEIRCWNFKIVSFTSWPRWEIRIVYKTAYNLPRIILRLYNHSITERKVSLKHVG